MKYLGFVLKNHDRKSARFNPYSLNRPTHPVPFFVFVMSKEAIDQI